MICGSLTAKRYKLLLVLVVSNVIITEYSCLMTALSAKLGVATKKSLVLYTKIP